MSPFKVAAIVVGSALAAFGLVIGGGWAYFIGAAAWEEWRDR